MDDSSCPNDDIERRQTPRFVAGRKFGDSLAWGVWDRRFKCWTEPPNYGREAAKRLARTIAEIHAAGLAEGGTAGVVLQRGLPFAPTPNDKDPEAWGVRDRRDGRLVKPSVFTEQWAEDVAALYNETYLAGLVEAVIRRAWLSPPRRLR